MVLLIAPAMGGYLGGLADERIGTRPFGLVLGLIAGLGLAVFRIRILLRSLSGENGRL